MGALRITFLYTSVSSSGLTFFLVGLGLVVCGFGCFVVLFLRRTRYPLQEVSYQPLEQNVGSAIEDDSAPGWIQTTRYVWRPLFALTIDFAILFICYPGLLSVIHCHGSTTFIGWSFMAFNTGDCVGKFIAFKPLPVGWTFVWSLVEASFFLVLFVGSLGLRQVNNAIFGSEAYALTLAALLALSHGYLCASCFVVAPQEAPENAKARAGSLAYVFNTAGIMLGTILSLIFPLLVIPRVCS